MAKALLGTKLSYSTTESGDYTKINGLRSIPDIGGTPNTIDTTNMDNVKYETQIQHLFPAQQYDFEIDMEDPSVTSNIKVISDLEDARTILYWKIEYPTGVTIVFKSDVRTTIKGGEHGDLAGFTMHLAPQTEPTRTVATSVSA